MPPPPARTLDVAAQRLAAPWQGGPFVLRLALVVVSIGGAALLLAASIAPSANLAGGLLDVIDGQLISQIPPLPEDLGEAAERSVVYDREGGEIAVLRVENRRIIELDEVPMHVRQAVIATEDTAFDQHHGVNWRAIVRALAGNVTAGDITSGASTITQQLVKNRVVGSAQTVDRKLREAVYAIELEQRFTKAEILEAYLNEVYLGNGVYGVGTAAEYYWGKDTRDLTVAEGALLAGIIRSPLHNDPVDNPLAAVRRRNIVLEQMAEEGFLDPADAESLQSTPLHLDVHELPEGRNPYLVDYVRELLKADPALGDDEVERDQTVLLGGLEIHTTLDPALQEVAHAVVAELLPGDDAPLGALTAVDPRTGELLAMGIGPHPYGPGPGQVDVNPAVPEGGGSGRQPGSAFKPFELVAALEDGISPTYVFDAAARYTHTDPACAGHSVGNYADASQGRLDMAAATARSSNTYFAHLLDRTGPAKLAEVAQRMGIDQPLEPLCSLVLGAADVYPLQMASAFGTLANAGVHCPPFAIARVLDREGRVISEGGGDCAAAVDPGVAARTTALLRGPIESGTASRRGGIGRPAAGKTGTTDEYHNAWFVGYIPQLSTAAWVGHEQPRTLTDPRCGGAVTGGCLPTMLWQEFMTRAIAARGLPVESFPAPPPLPLGTVPGVVGAEVATAEGTLADAGFSAATETVTDHREAGTVVTQDPPGGTQTELGSAVALGVSDGQGAPPRMPDLVGLPLADARQRLSDLDLDVVVVEVPVADPAALGEVVGQRPSAGTSTADLQAATLEVGRARTAEDPDPAPSTPPSPAPTAPPDAVPAPDPTAPSRPPPDEEEQPLLPRPIRPPPQ
ncbi:MAG: transglycosylase domain-containing protein [Egibacteraceae bacterium]